MKNRAPYHIPVDELAEAYETDLQSGLSEKEAKKRLEKHGPNALPESHHDALWRIFLRQFKNSLLYILLVAAVLLWIFGSFLDFIIVAFVLLFNAVIGTFQEGRAQNILEKLRRLAAGECMVMRDGEKMSIPVRDVVPGDIIVIRSGQRVPADARIFHQENVMMDESVLTGESKQVSKKTESLSGDVPLFERDNMVFNGTYCIKGSGRAVVVATGLDTVVGSMHTTIRSVETDMPLKGELERLSYWIVALLAVVALMLICIGILYGKTTVDLVMTVTTLFIAAIPEGLPVVFTVVLASGAYNMTKYNVLVKRLQAAEGLGRTDILVVDKTGTLTRNEMVLTRLIIDGKQYTVSGTGYEPEGALLDKDGNEVKDINESMQAVAEALHLLDTSELEYNEEHDYYQVHGDPTEAAMGVCAKKMDVTQKEVNKEYKCIFELPFTSERKFRARACTKNDTTTIFIAGSPELLFEGSSETPKNADEQLQSLLDEGLRVIAIATYTVEISVDDWESFITNEAWSKLTMRALLGMRDPVREEAAHMVTRARNAGLKIIMATGDHKETAQKVAEETHILQEDDVSIIGAELDELSDEELQEKLDAITVFARVTPDHKVRILEAYHARNKRVAMTGDGINDVPSLAGADIGIAMGESGTDVAKEAADLVLLDDRFSSIIKAIEQGRHIFYALRRVVLYFFSTNLAEILLIFISIVIGLPLPVYAVQLLWVNFVSDGFLDIGLSMEPREEGLLEEQWLRESQQKGLIDKRLVGAVVYMATPMAIGSSLVFYWYQNDLPLARTMALVTLTIFQWFNAWNCRSENRSLFSMSPFRNPYLIAATAIVIVIQLCIIYVPFLQHAFHTVPIGYRDWGIAVAAGSSIIVIDEVRKWILRIR